MAVWYSDSNLTLHLDDCLIVMRKMPDCSVDSIVTDPPYGLKFMGKAWDNLSPGVEWATECLRILKPGGHLLAFGGSRTWHRLATTVENAGFELRDSIAWLHGQGFPKSHNVETAVSKRCGEAGENEWRGWGTALKPAFEPIVVGRKPLTGTVAANVLAHGTGALNIDGCRVGSDERVNAPSGAPGANAYRFTGGDGRDAENARAYAERSKALPPTVVTGRWPTNVVLDESQAAELDQQTGILTSGSGSVKRASSSDSAGNRSAAYGAESRPAGTEVVSYGDSGGASRFFPTFHYEAKAPSRERPKINGVGHPTVKPLALMRWLVRLVTPPKGIVLDTFLGSGTTAEAALLEGFACVGIDDDTFSMELTAQRLGLTQSGRGS